MDKEQIKAITKNFDEITDNKQKVFTTEKSESDNDNVSKSNSERPLTRSQTSKSTAPKPPQ